MRTARAHVDSDMEKIGRKADVSTPRMALRVAKLSAFIRTKKQFNALQLNPMPIINGLTVNFGGSLCKRHVNLLVANLITQCLHFSSCFHAGFIL